MVFFLRMLRDKYKLMLVYIVSTIGLLETFVAIFPSIKQLPPNIADQFMKSMPPAILEMFGMDSMSSYFDIFEGYLSSEYMSLLWPIIAVAFAVSLANYISVREIESGTAETLLSLPVRRSRIFIERYLAGLLMTVIFSVTSLVGALPLAKLHHVSYVFDNFVVAAVGCSIFAVCVFTLATLFSTIFSAKGNATMISSGALVIMYVMNVVSILNDKLDWLRYLSVFHYFNGSSLLGKGIYPSDMFAVLGGATMVLFAIALIRFSRRDFST